MHPVGSLQPRFPSPTIIPLQNYLYIIDLKHCLINIPFYEEDRENFAFSVPMPNHHAPCKHYHWKVLPQGMTNSTTICQDFVALVLEALRQKLN
jgi:hypothetical protein